jgi:hypothetical protein
MPRPFQHRVADVLQANELRQPGAYAVLPDMFDGDDKWDELWERAPGEHRFTLMAIRRRDV